MTSGEIHGLINQDSGEEFAHGQTVRNTFPEADFFLRIDADTDAQIKARVERFLHIILGTKLVTPACSETAMYLAASAAGNSACLSRQVGAALTDPNGEVIAVGWNDVPKAGGNLYVSDPKNDADGENDKRCWNLGGGICFNDREKRTIAELLVHDLVGKDIIDAQNIESAISHILSNSKVKDLIEFSRAIHAEMHAILLGSRTAGERIKGSSLFSTTYPCHSCARHIIAAGVSEVYYIEPYRKSLGTKLHDDAITEDETDTSKVRILPYDGVAPTRYLRFFTAPKSSRKDNGKMQLPDPKLARPRFEKTLEAFPKLEELIFQDLLQRHLVPEEAEQAQQSR
jgi:deoxycytidylate deaminase